MSKLYDLIVLGGGASGMMAAITAARCGSRVAIIEHNNRIGKKILSTGNGKCNLSNQIQGRSMYDGSDPDFAVSILEDFSLRDTLDFFAGIGVPVVDKNGYYYPRSQQASTVLDALRFEVERLGITVLLSATLQDVHKKGEDFFWNLYVEEKQMSCRSKAALISVGGMAASKLGSDGSANRIIEAFGHRLILQYPVLVPLETDLPCRKALAGVRSDMALELYVDGKKKASEYGQLQWTDYGISGIPVFQISHQANLGLRKNKNVEVVIDLIPECDTDALREDIRGRQNRYATEDVSVAMNGFLHKKLLDQILKMNGISTSDVMYAVSDRKWENFLSAVKSLRLHVTKSRGFDQAQATGGGVDTKQLTNKLESTLVSGLYFAGEVIDIDGKCGGYNLQWAWSSGYVAGLSASKRNRYETENQ